MKKLLAVLAFIFVLLAPAFAQKTYLFNEGKSKGSVPSIILNATVFVDAQAMARKLGGESNYYSQSQQLRVKIGSFSALFTAGKREVTVNNENTLLPLPAQVVKSKIYVPVEFFLDKRLSEALNKQLSFSDGKYSLEKFYNVEYVSSSATKDASFVFFATQGTLSFKTNQKNRNIVEVELEGAIAKRLGTFKVKDDLINTFYIKSCGKNECLRFVMKPKAKGWAFEYDNGMLVFKAFANAQAAGTAPQAPDAPVIAPAQPQTPDEDDEDDGDAEELDAGAFFSGPVIAAAEPAVKISAGKPAAVITAAPAKGKKMRIMIDPGHGGKDPGAVRKYSTQEKTINLIIAKEVYDILKKKGFDVKMTRSDDRFLALSERSKLSNDFKADLFVSIHTNASAKTAANGFEVYFRSEKASDAQAAEIAAFENESLQYEETHFNFADMLLRSLAVNEYVNESSKLAGYVRNSVKNTKGIGITVNPNNSIKQANFYVLKGVDSPAVLVECGYISNLNDRKQLNTKLVRLKIADGIAKGIMAYAKAEGF
ncbi:N-acetylmuramoyl-L-alanine amidase [Elusimicrobium simillimum]|uniref:N-acetylmuramoyl-L-alanine amidase n=1 Tax=Elusimicrobium simillimum TaxID=3143438 RepID=UPI003C6F0958